MNIASREVDGIVVLKLVGRLTLEEISVLDRIAKEHMRAGRHRFVLNMVDVRDLSSSGLGEILRLQKSAQSKGGGLALADISSVTAYVLDLARLKDIFQSFPSDDAAVNYLKRRPAPPA